MKGAIVLLIWSVWVFGWQLNAQTPHARSLSTAAINPDNVGTVGSTDPNWQIWFFKL